MRPSGAVRVVRLAELGPVLPHSIQELGSSTVEIEVGSQVTRGVLGKDVRFLGTPFFIGGPVCGVNSIHISLNGENGSIDGGILAGRSFAVSTNGQGRLRVTGGVSAMRMSIRRAIVYGNVVAENASIDECIVLGHIGCSNELNLQRSLVTSFHADKVTIDEGCSIISFAATAKSEINLCEPLLSLALISLEDLSNGAPVPTGFAIQLTTEDVHFMSDRTTLTVDPFDRLLNLHYARHQAFANGKFVASLIAASCVGRVRGEEIRTDRETNERGLWAIQARDRAGFEIR